MRFFSRKTRRDVRVRSDRLTSRPRLEGLEDRCLLSITEFPTPTASSGPSEITAGPDGNLWFTENSSNKIGVIDTASHAISEYPVPTANSAPFGITAGPDGNLWFTEPAGEKIGTINPTTRAIAEYPIPTAGWPERISAGPDGNLWFTEHDGNQIGMINPTTHAIAEFPTPTVNSRPIGITAGPDGNLWFTETYSTAHKLGMINPTTDVMSEFTIPYTGASPHGITAGPDGNVWFTDPGTQAIGVATLHTNADHFVVTQQPPSSITAGNPFGVTVQADDSSGNLDSSFNGIVTVALASNPGGDTLGGTVSVTASSGVATFSGLTLTRAASGYTLQASAIGVDSVTTSALTVTPASATQLVITQQPPATVKVSSSFALKASIEDAYGNVVTTASGTVGVAFANNPTGATLGGTTSVTVSQGVASFTNLTINKTGSGYTLQVSSSGLTPATSNPIKVSQNGKAPVRLLALARNPSPDLSLAPLVLDSPDLWQGMPLKRRPRSS